MQSTEQRVKGEKKAEEAFAASASTEAMNTTTVGLYCANDTRNLSPPFCA
jgi:hypothetical protein